MKHIRPSESILVLDLDDTLYAEYDYKLSGIRAVCARIAELYPEYRHTDLFGRLDTEGSGWLDQLCALCGFNASEKQTLLWLYRTHTPDIRPFVPPETFKALIAPFAARILLSDGRSLTQRLKLNALGLADCFDEILISEAFSSEKPDEKRFVHIQNRHPGRQYVYVGDNIAKDFVTPNRLGWLTVGIRPAANRIHRHRAEDFPPEHLPRVWLERTNDLGSLCAESGKPRPSEEKPV